MQGDKKKIVYLDMDGVLADFHSGQEYISLEDKIKYKELKLIPRYYLNLKPLDGAKDAVKFLEDHFDLYVLSTAPWDNPDAWKDKRLWIEKHFPSLTRKLTLTHRKDLLLGDYLVDDMLWHGAKDFKGRHIHFGSDEFPDWDSVINFFKQEILDA